MPLTSSFSSLNPTIASTSSKKSARPTGPIIYKHLRNQNETYTDKEFIKLMKGKPSGLQIWHNHKTFISDRQNDPQEVLYALSAFKDL